LITLSLKIALGLSSFQFMAMARRGLFYTFLSIYLREVLGLSVTGTTLLASLTMIANSFSQTFLWGKLSDKYQARASLIVIGETIAAVGYIAIYYVHIYLLDTATPAAAAYSIIAGLTILEFFWSMSNLGWSALISDLTTTQERGKLMSIVSSIGGVGQIVGITVSGMLYDWGGPAGGFKNGILFFFASAIMLVSVAAIWLPTRSPKRTPQSSPTRGHTLRKDERVSKGYGSKAFYWFLASIFIVGLGTHSILQIFILYVKLDAPIAATSFEIAMIRNSASIAIIITSLLAGPIADKIGRKNALGLGLSLATITPVFYIFAQNTTQMIVINSLYGASSAFMSVVGYLLAADLIPVERRGRLFGQYNATTYISFGIAGTLIGGPVADYLINTGVTEAASYVITFQVAAAISLIGTILFALKVKASDFQNAEL